MGQGGSPSPGAAIRREQRLRYQRDFQAISRHNLSRAHPLLVLRMAPNSLPYSRFGFVVGRRVSRKAVVRNRVRRRIREAVRRTPVRGGWDLLFVARPSAADATYQTLREVVLDLGRRARVLETGPEASPPVPGAQREE